MAVTTFKRLEKKFYITRAQHDRLLPIILQHMDPDPYCLDGKNYNLVNLYFDDDDDSVIINSLLKPRYKEKLRLRCYGPPASDDTVVYFEIKSKLYGTVIKRRAGMSYGDALEYIETGKRPETDIYIYKQVLDEIDELRKRKPCKPKLIISYDRSAYYLRGDPAVRLTFDENIMSERDDLNLSHYRGGEYLIPPDDMILEIKISGAMPLWLSQTLSDEGIFMTSFSKYGKEYKNRQLKNKKAGT